MALCEKQALAELTPVNPLAPSPDAEFLKYSPWQRVPILIDGGVTIAESSIIIEHVDLSRPDGVRLVPGDSRTALAVRYADRALDWYFITPLRQLFFEGLKPAQKRSARRFASAHEQIEDTLGWMEAELQSSEFLAGNSFSMADCGAAAALNRAATVHPFGNYRRVTAYFDRLHSRPSFAATMRYADEYAAQNPGLAAAIERLDVEQFAIALSPL